MGPFRLPQNSLVDRVAEKCIHVSSKEPPSVWTLDILKPVVIFFCNLKCLSPLHSVSEFGWMSKTFCEEMSCILCLVIFYAEQLRGWPPTSLPGHRAYLFICHYILCTEFDMCWANVWWVEGYSSVINIKIQKLNKVVVVIYHLDLASWTKLHS